MSARILLASGLVAIGLAAFGVGISAVEGGERLRGPAPGNFDPAHRNVELFAAVEAGEIEVRFIPRDETKARVLVANKTDKPLNVQLPEVFAGVPVLAQFQPGRQLPPFNNQQNNRNNNQNNAQQAVGGAMNLFPGGGQNGNQRGQNFFNVPAGKQRKLTVRCICLEHGKTPPRPAVRYQLVPLEAFNSDASLAQMLRQLGSHDLDQQSAQAAAWYLTGDLDWSQLEAKTTRRANGARSRYFSESELDSARQIVAAAQAAQTPSPGATGRESAAAGDEEARNSLGFAAQID